jgi:VWFA-related protein
MLAAGGHDMKRLLLILALGSTLQAQRLTEQVTVNVVEVPVYVERFGRPVRGLTRDDFRLYVNGAEQTIDYFDVIDEKQAAAPDVVATPPPLEHRRLFVLLFDVKHASPMGLGRAQERSAAWIDAAPPGDVFAVAIIGGYTGVRFVMPFSTDRIALKRAVSTLRQSAARDPFSLATLAGERRQFSTAQSRGIDGSTETFGDFWGQLAPPGTVAGDYQSALASAAKLEETHELIDARDFVESLTALADRLAPLSGIKHVVLMTDQEISKESLTFLHDTHSMHRHFQEAGVVLDAVDVGLPVAVWPSRDLPMPNLAAPKSLYALALDTGGAVTQSMASLQERSSLTYVLGFQPTGPQKERNSIRVDLVHRPFLTDVRHRKSYTLGQPGDRDDGILLADALVNDIPQNGVTVDLDVASEPRRASIEAAIPGAELLAFGEDEPLLVDVYQYVFDDRNLIAGWSQTRVSLDLDKGRDFLEGNSYRIRKSFTLVPGKYTAKVLARVIGAGAVGLKRQEFVVSE